MSYEEQKIERAEARAASAERERDASRAELAQVKRDVQWCMDHAIIRDIIMKSDQLEFGGDKPIDDQDSARLDYVNHHGRVCMGDGVFLIAIPIRGSTDSTVPVPFNVRHILDVARL